MSLAEIRLAPHRVSSPAQRDPTCRAVLSPQRPVVSTDFGIGEQLLGCALPQRDIMGRLMVGAVVVIAVIGGMSNPAIGQQPPLPWNQCCGTTPWPMDPGMMGRGMMGSGMASMPRHHVAMMWGVPAPYSALSNPLPRTKTTVDSGAKVYAGNCSSCHGPTGHGNC